MQPEDLLGYWKDNQGNHFTVKDSWTYIKEGRSDLLVNDGDLEYKVEDAGSFWTLKKFQGKDWRLFKDCKQILWKSVDATEDQLLFIPVPVNPQNDDKSHQAVLTSPFKLGDEIFVNDRNPLYKKWHFVKGCVVTRKERTVVVKLSALGKILEVDPRDIGKAKEDRPVTPKSKSVAKRAAYHEILQGKWYNSDGLEIDVKGGCATFLNSGNQYRIIFDTDAPYMMIGKVQWELRVGYDQERIQWTDFKNKIEWFREVEQVVAKVTPGFVPVSNYFPGAVKV